MTRRQAVEAAIKQLSVCGQNQEIIEKLQDMLGELPLSAWTKKSIIDAIEDYAIGHDHVLPGSKELTAGNHLPSNTVIYHKFGISSIDKFYQEYFPQFTRQYKASSPYRGCGVDYFSGVFMENYQRIRKKTKVKYVDTKIYNRYKEANSPHLCTIIKKCGCKSYEELLILCGFKQAPKAVEATVSVSYVDSEERNQELHSVCPRRDRKAGSYCESVSYHAGR